MKPASLIHDRLTLAKTVSSFPISERQGELFNLAEFHFDPLAA